MLSYMDNINPESMSSIFDCTFKHNTALNGGAFAVEF